MAGLIPNFLAGSHLVLRIGTRVLAYATNLSFTDNMALAPVSGIGSHNADAIEPLQYTANGSMTITRYSTATWNALKALGAGVATKHIPSRAVNTPAGTGAYDGNSLLTKNSFSPAALLISTTFDIDVYERTKSSPLVPTGSTETEFLLYKIGDVRLTSYSLSFMPGSLIQENVTFMAMSVVDTAGEYLTKNS